LGTGASKLSEAEARENRGCGDFVGKCGGCTEERHGSILRDGLTMWSIGGNGCAFSCWMDEAIWWWGYVRIEG